MSKNNKEFSEGSSFDIIIERLEQKEELIKNESPIYNFARSSTTYSVKRPRVTSSDDKNWTIPEELDTYFKHIDYSYEDDSIFITGFYLNKPGDVDNMIALLNAIKERMGNEEQN